MAAAASARAAPLHPDLPDEIFIWEILPRLPPKDLLRCRAVSRPWRRAISTREFLLVHHTRQPSFPLLEINSTDDSGGYLDIMQLEHRAGVATADQLHTVARLGTRGAFTSIVASCDGILILCTREDDSCFSDIDYYSVCNPATRQYAPLPQLRGLCVAAVYPHPPTGEYRLLLYLDTMLVDDRPELPGEDYDSYVYTLGSCEPPRNIGAPETDDGVQVIHEVEPVLFRGGLHWFIEKDEMETSMLMVFDIIAESFRWMRPPAATDLARLFEMDGMLGMASFNDPVTTIDIWTMQDYDSEDWAFKHQVELPVAVWFGDDQNSNLVVSSWDDDDDVLILVQSGEWILQIGMGGELVANFHRESLGTTQLRLKQTLVPHTFFPTIEGYVENTWPFISPDDHVVNT